MIYSLNEDHIPRTFANVLKSKIREKQESKSDDLIQNIDVILYFFYVVSNHPNGCVLWNFFFLIEDTLCAALSFEI